MRKRLPLNMSFDPLKAVHYMDIDPGTNWRKASGIAIDLDRPLDSQSVLTPNVVQMNDGLYRMYYTGLGPDKPENDCLGYILSASSSDAIHWTKDPGIRVPPFHPHAKTRTLCPDVIPLKDGRYRMYFEARNFGEASVVLSAISRDGLHWVPEPGTRIADGKFSYGSPRCIYIEGEYHYRLYFHRYTHPIRTGLDAGNHIISAVSKDGLEFEIEEGVRIAQEKERETYSVYAPEVIRLGDGSYRMYYSGWSTEICGGVFSATSKDGLNWNKDNDISVELGEGLDSDMVSEPCVINTSEERVRLFYEARDEKGCCRILAADVVA